MCDVCETPDVCGDLGLRVSVSAAARPGWDVDDLGLLAARLVVNDGKLRVSLTWTGVKLYQRLLVEHATGECDGEHLLVLLRA